MTPSALDWSGFGQQPVGWKGKRHLASAAPDQVARQLMAKHALGANARDELGISDTLSARPVQAG